MPPCPQPLVLPALLNVIFDYCFWNWHGTEPLDCGSPWRGTWWIGVFKLRWSWSLVACECCWGLLVILVDYFINTKMRKHLKKSFWNPGWGCVKVFVLLFWWCYLCDSIILHSTRNAQLVDMMWCYFWVWLWLVYFHATNGMCQKLGKESRCSEGFSSCSWNGNIVVCGGWLKSYRWKGLDEEFIAL